MLHRSSSVHGLLMVALAWTLWGVAPSKADEPKAHCVHVQVDRPRQLKRARDPLLLRELVRQSLLLSAREQFGAVTRDACLGESASPTFNTTSIGVEVMLDPKMIQVTLTGPGQAKMDVNIARQPGNVDLEFLPSDCDEVIVKLESRTRGDWVELLRNWGVPVRAAVPSGNAQPSPAVHRLLDTWNELAQYQAVRLLHQQMREQGESPALLGALVRGYSHLGQLCRYHDSAAESVFHARALLYAQRLAAAFPSRTAVAHRVYAKALAGMEIALATEEPALQQAGPEALPAWFEPIRQFCQFAPGDLEADTDPTTASLSAYLRFVLAERSRNVLYMHPRFQALTARQPLCLRAIDSMADQPALGNLHVMTELGPQRYVRAVRQLIPTMPQIPPQAAAAAKQFNDEQWPNLPVPALTGDLRQAAQNDSLEPSWAVLASLVEAPHVRQVYRRAAFMKFSWSVPVAEFLDQALPSIRGHHLEPVFHALKLDPNSQARQIDQIMATVDLQDIMLTFHLLMDQRWWGKTQQGAPVNSGWWIKMTARTNNTSDDLCLQAIYLTWSGKLQQKNLGDLMQRVCPNSPITLSMIARTQEWAEVERASAGWNQPPLSEDPTLVWAWANRLVDQERFDEAQAKFEQYVKICPDARGFQRLADVYDKRGDADQWLATMIRFLDSGQDAGLGRAQTARTIAYRLMALDRIEEAVKYAEQAAQSGAGWAFQTAAIANERAGRWDQANHWQRQRAERYPDFVPDWYLWCRRTNRGDLAAARQAAQAHFNELGDQLSAQMLVQRGMFKLLEGNIGAARDDFESAYQIDESQPYWGLMAAILSHQAGDADRRNQMLAQMHVEWAPAQRMDSRLILETVLLWREHLSGRQPRFDRASFDARLKKVAAQHQLDALYVTSQVLKIIGQSQDAQDLLRQCTAKVDMASEDSSRVLALAELHAKGIDAYSQPLPRLEEPRAMDVKKLLEESKELERAKKLAESQAVLTAIIDQLGHTDAVSRMASQLFYAEQFIKAAPYADRAASAGDTGTLLFAARCCEAAGRLERSNAWLRRLSELAQAGDDRWYFWCRRTNFGDLDEARASARRALLDRELGPQYLPRRVVFLMLEGQHAQAQAIIERELENKQGWAGIYQIAMLDPATSTPRMKEILLLLGGPNFRTSDFAGFGMQTRYLARRFAESVRDVGKPAPTINDIENQIRSAPTRSRVDAWYFASQAYRALGQAEAADEALARCITSVDTETVSQVLAYAELRKRGKDPMARPDPVPESKR
jgi:tetratricopeptide (TPR) repeat protein